MTSCVRILSTSSVDSSPSILLVATDGSKVLVNCGEGCQRTFLEYGQRLASVSTVCICSLNYAMVGGLPGAILTTADAVATSETNTSLLQQFKKENGQKGSTELTGTSHSVEDASGELLPQLEVVGPNGTQLFIHSLRHFMRREQFRIKIHEGTLSAPIAARCGRQSNSKKQAVSNKKMKTQSDTKDQHYHGKSMSHDRQQQPVGFTIQSLAVCETINGPVLDTSTSSSNSESAPDDSLPFQKQCLSFIVRMPSTPGKFLKDKAVALGVPKGPLFGTLKAGQDVSFLDSSTGQTKVVKSVDVVEPMHPAVVVMILYYPTASIAQQLFASEVLQKATTISRDDSEENTYPELVLHISTQALFEKYGIPHWQGTNPSDVISVEHVFLSSLSDSSSSSVDDGTPFRSAEQGAYARSALCPHIFHSPQHETSSPLLPSGFRYGRATMEYTLLPRSKRGFTCHGRSPMEYTESMTLVESTGALTMAHDILKDFSGMLPNAPLASSINPSASAELVFLGTGSAMPCKHRNVTGMLLKQADGRSILLDVGEGTIGQLLRMHPREYQMDIYGDIKAVWISHPHADHHLGLLRLLKDRPSLDPLLLLAPTPIFRFLNEYAAIDSEILGTYVPIDCKDLIDEDSQLQQTIHTALGISTCRAVPVSHCAHAYGVIFEGTDFGTVVYSGDCRPCSQLALAAKGADVLIHEATFEGGMEAEAVLKKHSTVDEAVNIGCLMECKCLVLTHFSQRYPKIPPIPTRTGEVSFPIVFAFDFMKLRPHTLSMASKLTPALRLLFPEDDTDDGKDTTEAISTDVLSIPGAFADSRFL